MSERYVVPFEELGMGDVGRVGGKNASLGEMISALAEAGVRVPGGFATTADAFWLFLRHDQLDRRIAAALQGLDTNDVGALTETGARIRGWIEEAPLPSRLAEEIVASYDRLGPGVAVAVRSSATAEDLPGPPSPASRRRF
jgi:pyruvate, water dikinase